MVWFLAPLLTLMFSPLLSQLPPKVGDAQG